MDLSDMCTHQCFNFIYFIIYHTGCLGSKLKNKRIYCSEIYRLYSYIYRLIYLIGLIGGFVIKIYYLELKEAILGQLPAVVKVVLTFQCIIRPIIYIIVCLHMDGNHDKYIDLANTLQCLDEKMQKHFPKIQWNYDKSRRKYGVITVILLGFYTIVSTIYVFNIAHCTNCWISSTVISVCYAAVTAAPAAADILFIGYMDFLRLRFRLIQKLVHEELITYEYCGVRHIPRIFKIKVLENYFTEYTSLIILLNKVFGTISSSGTFHDLAFITSLGYVICSKALDNKSKAKDYIFINLFMIPRIYKVVITAIYGHNIQKERDYCFREFIKVGYYFERPLPKQKHMEAFLHWRLHNSYIVTVGKTLNCNTSLIYLVLNSIVNYIMILIQLQFQHNHIVNSIINKDAALIDI